MATELIEWAQPGIDGLDAVARALGAWQDEGARPQLHPGDLGWFWRYGAPATAAAVRTWSADGRIVAAGPLDGPGLLRLATAPDLRRDERLARRLAADLDEPDRGVLPAGTTCVEAPADALVRDLLAERGWVADERWTPLRHDLSHAEPVEAGGPRDVRPDAGAPDLRIEVVGPERAAVRAAVQRAAFDGSTFTAEHWHAMASGVQYADARCLVGYDERDAAVAMVTVWSAGRGRPGLLEPVGVHREHRRRGHGTAIVRAAVAALRGMGASSAVVCTPSARTAAVATYRSAGFRALPGLPDLRRDAGR